jgi:site-specific DNA recombinase
VGHASFGYTVNLDSNGKDKIISLHPVESEIVKEIFEKIAYENYTTTSITKYLNSKNTQTKWSTWAEINTNKRQTYLTNKGNERDKKSIKWTYSSVKQLLKNRWYVGERKYKELTLTHDKIVSEELFNLANSKLKNKQKNR